MTVLPEIFVVSGIEHVMLKRTIGRKQDVALYKRMNLTHAEPTPHYEVILIGRQEEGEREIAGVKVRYEAKELYPSVSQWGALGFTFQKYDAAESKYLELEKRAGKKL